MRGSIQKFGRAMSAMVMPNIGAFIAWGFITALFIPSGWWPNERLAGLVPVLLTYLLPLLIGYTGGRNVGGDRGGIIGAIATMGVIAGSDVPMFIGAMIMGPAAGWCIKQFDRLVAGRIKAGFEMLVNNFSLGIIGMLLAIFGYLVVGGAVAWLTGVISAGADIVIRHGFLPLVALIVEPAKVLFLNNALNHGIFSPIGIEQTRELGSSVMLLIETNPGPGFGMLLAYWLFGRGSERQSAPGAVIIQFLGGIHEIYFPYILARPVLILSTIAGSAAGLLFWSLTGAGLVAPASPGSIISVLAMAPKGMTLTILAGVMISAAVAFVVAMPFIRTRRLPAAETVAASGQESQPSVPPQRIGKVVFACDAGMGSSALGATRFRKRVEQAGLDVEVTNSAADRIPDDADVIVCQQIIARRLEGKTSGKRLVVIDNFLSDKELDALFECLAAAGTAPQEAPALPLLQRSDIIVGLASESREDAIRRVGGLLVAAGYVAPDYVEAMLQRESLSTTCMGMGLAIPHGTSEAKSQVLHSGIAVLQYPEGVDFEGETVRLVIGIAGVGDEHLTILASLAGVLEDEALLERLSTVATADEIFNTLNH